MPDEEPQRCRLRVDTSDPPCIEHADSAGNIIWRVPVEAVVIFAEYTTPYGPWLDDYFLVFGYLENGKALVRSASIYSDGSDDMLRSLSDHWGAPLQFGLCNSTDWKSRVIWPESLEGQNYFESTEVPATTFLGRCKSRFLGKTYEYPPTAAVKEYVKAKLGDSTSPKQTGVRLDEPTPPSHTAKTQEPSPARGESQ
jgi:hypothetical protein